jgi:hypothetical protein
VNPVASKMGYGVRLAGPWSARDRRLVLVWLAVGAILVVLSWFLAAGKADPADQLGYLSLAVVGGLMWLSGLLSGVARGRRQVGRRARMLLGPAPSASLAAVSAETLVAGGDRQWFHRADCLLARSRNWPTASRFEHEHAGRQPCPACNP